jgi:hypothetical protein
MTVIYANGKEVFISNPTEFPDLADNKTRSRSVEEPMGQIGCHNLLHKLTYSRRNYHRPERYVIRRNGVGG